MNTQYQESIKEIASWDSETRYLVHSIIDFDDPEKDITQEVITLVCEFGPMDYKTRIHALRTVRSVKMAREDRVK